MSVSVSGLTLALFILSIIWGLGPSTGEGPVQNFARPKVPQEGSDRGLAQASLKHEGLLWNSKELGYKEFPRQILSERHLKRVGFAAEVCSIIRF